MIAVLVGAALLARLAAMPCWQAWARRYAWRVDAHRWARRLRAGGAPGC